MKYLQVLALIFMVWEFCRTIFLGPLYWHNAKSVWHNRKNKPEIPMSEYKILTWIGYIYVIFCILLVFSQWWWIGLSIFALSMLSALVMFPLIANKEPFNLKIFLILLIDSAITIFLLANVINPLSLLNG